ncbi:hypothetical protein E2542_SST13208 [Spatholobus suberectus]|nr:hypothetical protein E2542_SST13208 [Spatholobus suberectus]
MDTFLYYDAYYINLCKNRERFEFEIALIVNDAKISGLIESGCWPSLVLLFSFLLSDLGES